MPYTNSQLSSVQVVFLDAGNTLLRADPPVERRYANTAREHGIELSATELKPRFRRLWRDYQELRSKHLFTTDREATRAFWHRFVTELIAPWEKPGPRLDSFFADLYEGFATRTAWRLFDDVLPALEGLGEMGLRLGVISNWDIRLPEMLEAMGLAPYFETVLVSAAEGLEKPAVELFERALGRLGVPASSALHVGDSFDEDVKGALDAGLLAAHLDRGEALPFYGEAPLSESRDHLVINSLLELCDLLARTKL